MAVSDDYEQHDEEAGAESSELAGLPKRERDYLIPAQDAKGHSARLQFRAQPSLVRQIADVHQSKKYPFRVQGDLLRFCVAEMVKRLQAGAGIVSVMGIADMVIETLRDQEYIFQFEEVFALLRKNVDRYIERRATQKARELVTVCRTKLDTMPEGYWKKQYLDELDNRYGPLLDGSGQVTGTGAFNVETDDADADSGDDTTHTGD